VESLQGDAPPDTKAIKAAWARLKAAPVCNRLKTLAYRAMHAGLPCGLRLAVRADQPGIHLCPNACCRSRPRDKPLDSLTHAFVECPAYAGARAWLQDTWHAVAGHRPPLDAEVLLGDREEAWGAYPDRALQPLWSSLRLAWLHALWAAHRSGNPSRRHANSVVAAAVRYLQQRMRSTFCSCDATRRIYDRLPLAVISTSVRELGVEAFRRQWAAGGGVLCDVLPDAVTGLPRLHVRLDLQHPVPAPPPPPLPPELELEEEAAPSEDLEEGAAVGVGR
jgi:hypothetical protein